jgi:uncharacterized membrane protein
VTNRGLKIALAVSVALNVFGLAGGAAALIAREKVEARVERQRTPGRMKSFPEILQGLDPAVRERVRTTLRASAQAARPDFQEARDRRQQAVALSAAPTVDPARITALLDQSRAAEIRGRERLERDAVALFATLGPSDRQALSVILNRKGRDSGGREGREGGKGGGKPPEHHPSI